jgi:peptide/nickel transport system substrate-binding protein
MSSTDDVRRKDSGGSPSTDAMGRSAFLARAAAAAAGGALLGPTATAKARTSIGRSLAQRSKTLRVGSESDIDTLDPHLSAGGAVQWNIRYSLFEPLIDYDTRNRPEPRLASRMTYRNPSTVDVVLREGVRFHSGAPFNAEAVRWNFNHLKTKKYAGSFANAAGIVERIEIRGANRLVLHLKQPTAPDVLFNQLSTVVMVDPTTKDQSKTPSGTGPYRFDRWVKGNRFEMSRFGRHWDRRNAPQIERVILRYILDEQARILNLQNGAVDMITRITYSAVDRVHKMNGLAGGVTSAPITLNIGFCNCSRGPLADRRVRKAVALSFDRRTWIRQFQYGRGATSCFSPLAPGHWALYGPATACAADYSAGLAAARQLLREAGYADGLELEILIPSGIPEDENRAVLYQDGLKKIGVESSILKLDPAAWFPKMQALDYDFSPEGEGYGGLADPSIWYTYDSVDFGGRGASGWSGYKNEQWFKLVEQGLKELTRAKRRQVYAQLQQLTMDDAPWWTEAWEGLTWGAKRSVRNVNAAYGALGHMNYAKVQMA